MSLLIAQKKMEYNKKPTTKTMTIKEETLQASFSFIIQELSKQIRSYTIPESHLRLFEEYKREYNQNRDEFFHGINSIETDIFSIFRERCSQSNQAKTRNDHLTSEETRQFLNGERLKRRAANHHEIHQLKDELGGVLSSNEPIIRAKFLPFLSPKLFMFISERRNLFFRPVESLLGSLKDVSFDFGYFRVNPGSSNPYWHDDYTLFKNEILDPETPQPLIVNCHLAISPVTKESSPLCFLQGSEKIVFARAAQKYFFENNIPHENELFLKSMFLSEQFYTPGQKVKANFLGLFPNLNYRLEKIIQGENHFEITFDPVEEGEFLIFSPHYLHTSLYENREGHPRESAVLRCFQGDYYCSKNVVSLREFAEMLSFANARELSLKEIQNHFFPLHKMDGETKLISNIYIQKPEKPVAEPRIYLDDLNSFFSKKS